MIHEASMKRFSELLPCLLCLILGIILGGYIFADSKPRSFLAINDCQNRCLNKNELAGLLVSAGIQKTPFLVPSVVIETDKTIVIDSPDTENRIHYIAIPKHDIRDASDLTSGEKEYLTDIYAVFGKLIRENKLVNYKIITNGRGYQSKTYLHFHFLAQ